MQKKKIVLMLSMALLGLTLLFVLDIPTLIDELQQAYAEAPLQTMGVFVLLFVIVTVTGLPGAALLTTSSGYLFGLTEGILLSTLSSCVSAQLSFLISRYLLREWFEERFKNLVTRINRDVDENGLSHLFLLRLIPGIPFPLLNMSYGVTGINGFHFWWVSMLGTLPITILLTNAGVTLGEMSSPLELFTPQTVLSLLALGLFPITVKWLYKKWSPKRVSVTMQTEEEQ